jgi:hypothetical protein
VMVAPAGGIVFPLGGPGPAIWRMPRKGGQLSVPSFVRLVLGNLTRSDRRDIPGCPRLWLSILSSCDQNQNGGEAEGCSGGSVFLARASGGGVLV